MVPSVIQRLTVTSLTPNRAASSRWVIPLAVQQCLHDAELPCGQEAGHQLELEQVLLVELVDAGLGCLVFNFTSADVAVKLCIGKA